MKRLALIVLLAAGIGCVPNNNDSSVRLIRALPVLGTSSQCGPSNTRSAIAGTYDIGSEAYGYLLAFEIESTLAPPELALGESNLATPNINDAILDTVELSYQLTPLTSSGGSAGAALPASTYPIYAIIRAGSSGQASNIWFNILTPSTINTLQGELPFGVPATQPVAALNVGVQLVGKLGSGQAVRTNKITFPLTLYNSGRCDANTTGQCGRPEGQEDSAPCP